MKQLTDPNNFTKKEEWENWVKSEEFRDSLKTELANYRDKGVVYSGPDLKNNQGIIHSKDLTPQQVEEWGKDFNYVRGLNRVQAEEWAKENKGITLETTQAGKTIETANLDKQFGDGFQAKIMDKASGVYAESLSGDVKAFTQGANKDDVFFKRELPALLENKDVPSINNVPKEEIAKSIKQENSFEEAHQLINKGQENIANKNETQIYQRSGENWNQYENLTQKAEQKNKEPNVRSEKENTIETNETQAKSKTDEKQNNKEEKNSLSTQADSKEISEERISFARSAPKQQEISEEKISFAKTEQKKEDISEERISFKKQEQGAPQQEQVASDRDVHRDAGNLGAKWDQAEAEKIHKQGLTPGQRFDHNEQEQQRTRNH